MKHTKTLFAILLAAALAVTHAIPAFADVIYEPDGIDPEFLVGNSLFIIIPSLILIAAAVGIFFILRAVRRDKRRGRRTPGAPEDKR